MGTTRRPWLAALLAFCYPGLGHIYLREWLRALLWFAIGFTTALLVVPAETTVDAVLAGTVELPLMAIISLAAITLFSMLDAYLLASQRRTEATSSTITCPHCRHEVDPDLEFCHWCTEPIAASAARSDRRGAVESSS